MGKALRIRDFVQRQSGRTDWYTIRNSADGSAEVTIYDEIGYFGVTAQNFIKDIAKVRGPITLRLNTPGGEVFDGLAIYNALRQRSTPVSVVIDGIAASIGSVIAMAASPGQLSIGKRAQLMIHDGFTDAVGNAADFRELADRLDEQSDNIAGVYADRTGKPVSYWRDKMRAETWYFGDQAVAEGLADRVFDGAQNALSGSFTNAKGQGGSHGDHQRYDPDGDGDCDACPSGDTDHDYWDADGNQIRSLPGRPVPRKKGKQAVSKSKTPVRWLNADKYNQADRDRMAKSGEAMPDGSYPIADEEDLHNAIRAVGRGKNNSHSAIRQHIIKRAHALGLESAIPDNWTSDGSSNQLADGRLLASLFTFPGRE